MKNAPGVMAPSWDALPDTFLGPNVYVFDPATSPADMQVTAIGIFQQMEANEFGPQRYALLFKPGVYNDVTFNVGFYMHVAGLGRSPGDVQINGGVNVIAEWMPRANSTCNFWGALENFAVKPLVTDGVTWIAVSQAALLRRLHVHGNLHLFDIDGGISPINVDGGISLDGFLDVAFLTPAVLDSSYALLVNDGTDLISRSFYP